MVIRSVAVVGAGASGAVTASALAAENYFERIRVFERRETAGGTWIFDADPGVPFDLLPGKNPPETDPPSGLPESLPAATSPSSKQRYDLTPIYEGLTTNVPDIAMSFSDSRFAYGPFAPHWVPKQYIESYFPRHGVDKLLVTHTTVEDISKLLNGEAQDSPGWRLTLRRFNPSIEKDEWWTEEFDAVILANGHYSVPFVPQVDGLEEYIKKFPGRVIHSKQFRSASNYDDKKVIIIGNSASGKDVSTLINGHAAYPLYQSRKSPSRWDGDEPPRGIVWKPIIEKYLPSGEIVFADGSVLTDVDTVIYCTGYKPSFPFWNIYNNGRPIYNYKEGRIIGNYLHTFIQDFRTLAIIGIPRALTFRSMEYQAIAVARLWAGRNSVQLPSREKQIKWESDRLALVNQQHRRFHDITWDNGETHDYLQALYDIAGLPQLYGSGRYPPVLNDETRWAIKHLKKYPEPKKDDEKDGFVIVERPQKDSLHFI